MKKWKERWNEMLPYEKKFEVASYVFAGLALAVMLFQIFLIIVKGGYLVDIKFLGTGLASLALGSIAVVSWRKERGTAIWLMIMGIWWGLDAIWEIVRLFT
jgi:hypothetical protein